MSWPQWTIIIVFSIRLGAALALDGKQPTTKISFIDRLFDVVVTSWLLWMGGFFSG